MTVVPCIWVDTSLVCDGVDDVDNVDCTAETVVDVDDVDDDAVVGFADEDDDDVDVDDDAVNATVVVSVCDIRIATSIGTGERAAHRAAGTIKHIPRFIVHFGESS